MTTIAILPESAASDSTAYRAVSGKRESFGRTPGEALDAMTTQLTEEESGTIVIVQNLHPDRFFTAEQRERLEFLMSRWRQARNAGRELDPEEQCELDALIQAEEQAASKRAEAILREMGE
ncbi:MAG: hypothetical protein ACREDR_02995 [Blastocatellia bacterium]